MDYRKSVLTAKSACLILSQGDVRYPYARDGLFQASAKRKERYRDVSLLSIEYTQLTAWAIAPKNST